MSSYLSAEKDMEMARNIAEKIFDLGGTAYYVGGYCRDKIMGLCSKDIDIEIYGVTPDQLRTVLDTLGTRTEHGKSFGIFGLKGYTIDIALPRKELCTGTKHTDFDVQIDPSMTTYQGAKRRDLTMNSIMINVLTDEIVDHFNGQPDIKNRIIRHVDAETFKEDPLRVLRVAQFAARFDFTVSPETMELCKHMDITTLSKERIWTELEKALTKSFRPSIFFNVLRDMGQLSYWFSEIEQLINIQEDKLYHPEGTVYNHTMKALDASVYCIPRTRSSVWFMLAIICHDMGKIAISKNDGIVYFEGHEKYGEDIATKFLKRFTDNNHLINYVCNLTKLHMLPHKLFCNDSGIKKTNHMFNRCTYPKDLILLEKCNIMGKQGIPDTEVLWLINRYKIYMKIMSAPYVKGEDLVSHGLKPGPYFSELLSFAHKLRLAGITKESALHQVLLRSRKVMTKYNY